MTTEQRQERFTGGEWEYRKGLPEGITTYDFKDNAYPSGPIPPHIVAVKHKPEPGIARSTSFICELITMAHDKDGSEMEANAYLIKAAPDLYAALAAYVKNDENQSLDDDEMYQNAVSALDKARGEVQS